jgi:hypothetical protein
MTAVTLRCDDLGFVSDGELEPGALLAPEGPVHVELRHAKRDGQVLFFFADDLTGIPLRDGRSSGRPGDVFAFGGDAGASGDEQRGQVLLVYGEDHLFVEPFDRGFVERGYQRIGALRDTEGLRRIGERIWRHGARGAELEVGR